MNQLKPKNTVPKLLHNLVGKILENATLILTSKIENFRGLPSTGSQTQMLPSFSPRKMRISRRCPHSHLKNWKFPEAALILENSQNSRTRMRNLKNEVSFGIPISAAMILSRGARRYEKLVLLL